MHTGLVGNIQRYCLHDGPGIRTTVFLKGCPLSCLWCHNPENRSAEAEIIVIEGRCLRCGACAKACLNGVCVPARNTAGAGAEQCTLCRACVDACPTGARQMIGRRMTVAEVLAKVMKDRIFYDDSQGGVTFSGGEPLRQWEFLAGLLRACRENGLHTAVDTCGFAPREHLLAVAPLADLFLYDLKTADDERHCRLTGVSNTSIVENLKLLGRVHPQIRIRIPIIPGINDNGEELEALARLAAIVPGVRQIDLLPYHRTAIAKFRRLGQAYQLADVAPPSPEYMESLVERLQACGVPIKVGA